MNIYDGRIEKPPIDHYEVFRGELLPVTEEITDSDYPEVEDTREAVVLDMADYR